jgi:hypothetical protein
MIESTWRGFPAYVPVIVRLEPGRAAATSALALSPPNAGAGSAPAGAACTLIVATVQFQRMS